MSVSERVERDPRLSTESRGGRTHIQSHQYHLNWRDYPKITQQNGAPEETGQEPNNINNNHGECIPVRPSFPTQQSNPRDVGRYIINDPETGICSRRFRELNLGCLSG